MPPRSRASDYAKGKITQDELIAIQIANDANIASARKAVKMGEPPQLTPLETASPDELLRDDAAQEATARTNLERIGFRPQEASQIITLIRTEPTLDFGMLNANYPAIETDIKKKFNPKLLTPTFFVEYLIQYKQELDASKGLSTGGLATISRNINALVNTIGEIRTILPDQAQMNELLRNAARAVRNTEQRRLLEPILDRIATLQTALPSPVDYQRIEQLNAVDRQAIIQELQTATANLPTRAQVDRIVTSVAEGRADSYSQLVALADSIDNGMKPKLDRILKEVKEVGDIQSQTTREIERLEQRQGVPSSSKKQLQDWDGVSFIIAEDDWLDLNSTGKKNYLKSRVRLGEAVASLSAINGANVGELNDLFDSWVATYGLAQMGQKPSGKAPPPPSSSSIQSGNTSNATATTQDLFGAKGGVGIRKMKVGKGIAVKETPAYREYGKYAIHIPQLEQQDILNVKYKSLGQIPKFKPMPVSDIFRDFVIDLLENGKPNARVYTQIAPEERKVFEEMSIGAGVWNGLGLKRTTTSTDEEENKRFELLKGEYIAGNNSPKVISELRRLVVKMMSDGRIRKNQGLELLMELSI